MRCVSPPPCVKELLTDDYFIVPMRSKVFLSLCATCTLEQLALYQSLLRSIVSCHILRFFSFLK